MTTSRSVAITYVAADCGSVIPGKSKAPQAFQDAGIAKKLRDAGMPIVSELDALDSPARYSVKPFSKGSVRNEELNISVCQSVRRVVSHNITASSSDQSPFQLILGGECCMCPAILSSFWEHAASQSPPKRVGLIYIDADTDLASPHDRNSTGNFAGMNMTHLIGRENGLESMRQFSRPSGEAVCDPSNMVLFGINMGFAGNKPEHFAYLFDNEYTVLSSESVALSPEKCARRALKRLEENTDIIMVHFDVDSIDPRLFPLANVPNFTGVTFEQMMAALRVFLASDKVAGLTIAEVNPGHDPDLSMVNRLSEEVVQMLSSRRSASP
ncbi:unnamed protein product [Clonostachys rosea f. rosea IK726]|uniref:Uncharacterized protein n=1 Tax=Clonostachys rosea f. rosea IK726 TaxID=1349383 RepID=A0ACA9U6Q2_BIOOC|nr:unnamed protein product [Clonostachys rosea f. rosea IK726]